MTFKRFFILCLSFISILMILITVPVLANSDTSGESSDESQRTTNAFSILMLGTDTGEYGRSDQGRSDVLVVATINLESGSVKMSSIPRDTYTEIIGMGFDDKINHAYAFGGIEMAADSVSNLLNIPIDNTIAVDMGGFIELVNSVGGISVLPDATFSLGDYSFQQGVAQFVDGEGALSYVRERYNSGGDRARQERAQEVILSLFKEALSPSNIFNLPKFIDAVNNHVQLNLTISDFGGLTNILNGSNGNFENVPLPGSGQMIDGIYYEILDPSSLEMARQAHRANLGLE